jgi:hypothetical protein
MGVNMKICYVVYPMVWNIYYIMFHTTWCELDMSCLKTVKQVRFGVKRVQLV